MASFDEYRDAHRRMDFRRRDASLDTDRIVLTSKEFDLLALLVQNAGETVPREDLLQRVWGYGPAIRTRTLDVPVRRRRQEAGPVPDGLRRDRLRRRLPFPAVLRSPGGRYV